MASTLTIGTTRPAREGSTVSPIHLNKHLDYTRLAGQPGFDPTARDHSLATPLDVPVWYERFATQDVGKVWTEQGQGPFTGKTLHRW